MIDYEAQKRSSLPTACEWWNALRPVLLTFTIPVLLALVGSFVSYERVISTGHPWLPVNNCPGCPFCGMTRSFCALSAGHFDDAMRWNRGGLALYGVFWVWMIIFAAVAWQYARRKMLERDRRI